MAESVYEGLTVGYCLALTQFVMVAVLGLMYLRKAERVVRPARRQGRAMVADRGDDREAGARRPRHRRAEPEVR